MILTGKDLVTIWQALSRALGACSCEANSCKFCRRYLRMQRRIEDASKANRGNDIRAAIYDAKPATGAGKVTSSSDR